MAQASLLSLEPAHGSPTLEERVRKPSPSVRATSRPGLSSGDTPDLTAGYEVSRQPLRWSSVIRMGPRAQSAHHQSEELRRASSENKKKRRPN